MTHLFKRDCRLLRRTTTEAAVSNQKRVMPELVRARWNRWVCLLVYSVALAPARGQTPKPLPTPTESSVLAATNEKWGLDGTSRAILVDTNCIHPSWIHPETLAPAKWIWAQPCTAADDEAHTFSTTFNVTGKISRVELDIAVDNWAIVSVNGQQVGRVEDFRFATIWDISKYVHQSSNQISIEVHNLPVGVPSGWNNPAGLLARLRTLGAPSKGSAPGANDQERP